MRLLWTKLAESDLDEIENYIGQDNPAAAVRVILELTEQVETLLLKHPAIGTAGRMLGTRELVIGGLPYIVPYRVREKDIEILRVLHTSRRWPEDL